MSFGISGESTKSVMIGGDVAVAKVDKATLDGKAEDYYLQDKSQCSGRTGSCPDTKLAPNTNSIRTLNVAVVNGYSIVTYQRPLHAADQYDKPIFTNASQPVIWAIGPLNDLGEVSFHTHWLKTDQFIDFGRPAQWNCPMPEADQPPMQAETTRSREDIIAEAVTRPATTSTTTAAPSTAHAPRGRNNPRRRGSNRAAVRHQEAAVDSERSASDSARQTRRGNVRGRGSVRGAGGNAQQASSKVEQPVTARSVPTPAPVKQKVKPWFIPPIQCDEPEDGVFYAQMGPTGGKQGYPAITGHVGWGISWYINGLLIPEIHVVRGQTYNFVVEGGDNPDIPAKYHPFYITDDSVGGYEHKTDEEKKAVRIFAGVRVAQGGTLIPTGTGRLCHWTQQGDSDADDFPSFGAYQRTLELKCDSPGEPGVIQWTPDKDTPDTVYYQCFTHRYLGWKIHVHDSCDQAGAASNVQSISVPAPKEVIESKADLKKFIANDRDLEESPSIRIETRVKPNDIINEEKEDNNKPSNSTVSEQPNPDNSSIIDTSPTEKRQPELQLPTEPILIQTPPPPQPPPTFYNPPMFMGNGPLFTQSMYNPYAFENPFSNTNQQTHQQNSFKPSLPLGAHLEEIKLEVITPLPLVGDFGTTPSSTSTTTSTASSTTSTTTEGTTTTSKTTTSTSTTASTTTPESSTTTNSTILAPAVSHILTEKLAAVASENNHVIVNTNPYSMQLPLDTRYMQRRPLGPSSYPPLPNPNRIPSIPYTKKVPMYSMHTMYRPPQHHFTLKKSQYRPIFKLSSMNRPVSIPLPQKPMHIPQKTMPLPSPIHQKFPKPLYYSDILYQNKLSPMNLVFLKPQIPLKHSFPPLSLSSPEPSPPEQESLPEIIVKNVEISPQQASTEKSEPEIQTARPSLALQFSQQVNQQQFHAFKMEPAMNTGFHPESVVVETGFKPIISKQFEERMAEEEVGPELEYESQIGVINIKDEQKYADTGTAIESFEPMFVPSPIDKLNGEKNFKLHKKPLKKSSVKFMVKRPRQIQDRFDYIDPIPAAAERVQTYYLPPIGHTEKPVDVIQEPSNIDFESPLFDIGSPPDVVVTYDGRKVSGASLTKLPDRTNVLDMRSSKAAELIKARPQFVPFKGELPPLNPEFINRNGPQLQQHGSLNRDLDTPPLPPLSGATKLTLIRQLESVEDDDKEGKTRRRRAAHHTPEHTAEQERHVAKARDDGDKGNKSQSTRTLHHTPENTAKQERQLAKQKKTNKKDSSARSKRTPEPHHTPEHTAEQERQGTTARDGGEKGNKTRSRRTPHHTPEHTAEQERQQAKQKKTDEKGSGTRSKRTPEPHHTPEHTAEQERQRVKARGDAEKGNKTRSRRTPHHTPEHTAEQERQQAKQKKTDEKSSGTRSKRTPRPHHTPEHTAEQERQEAKARDDREKGNKTRSRRTPHHTPEHTAEQERQQAKQKKTDEKSSGTRSKRTPEPHHTPEHTAEQERQRAKARDDEDKGNKTRSRGTAHHTPEHTTEQARQEAKQKKTDEKGSGTRSKRTPEPHHTPEHTAEQERQRANARDDGEKGNKTRSRRSPHHTPEHTAEQARQQAKQKKTDEKDSGTRSKRTPEPHHTPEHTAKQDRQRAKARDDGEKGNKTRSRRSPHHTPEHTAEQARQQAKQKKTDEKGSGTHSKRTPEPHHTPEHIAEQERQRAKARDDGEKGNKTRSRRSPHHTPEHTAEQERQQAKPTKTNEKDNRSRSVRTPGLHQSSEHTAEQAKQIFEQDESSLLRVDVNYDKI